MSKLSRRERKRIKAGKSEGYSLGYAEGYAKGLYDGNPFNAFARAVQNTIDGLNKTFNTPEFREALKKAREANDDAGVLDLIEDTEEETEENGEEIDAVQDAIDTLGYPY